MGAEVLVLEEVNGQMKERIHLRAPWVDVGVLVDKTRRPTNQLLVVGHAAAA
jgi:hypothetical protein